ncbi:MAG: hypothetical protein AAGB13_18460 [Cyanobacteria bacterium P01_F01_bin.33]
MNWRVGKVWLAVVAVAMGIWMMALPTQAMVLGEQVEPARVSLRVAESSYGVVEEAAAAENIRASVNDSDRVFQLQIDSTSDIPPAATDYLGEYAGYATETLAVIPLRGRIEKYQQGDREARWSIFGQSGRFHAEATAMDLMPSNMKAEVQ